MDFSDILNIPLCELARRSLKTVTVAVLDTGIDASHEALVGRVVKSIGYRRECGVLQSCELARRANNDPSGHGTGVAAIIATLARNARLIDCRVLDGGGCGYGVTVLQGLRDAIDSPAEIINVSLAFAKGKYWDEAIALLEEAYRRNKIVVAARRSIPQPGDLGLPAEISTAISVDIGKFQSPYMIRFLGKAPIEFAASGVEVMTAQAGGGYVRMTGTSFATPVVTAMCALMRGVAPGIRLFEIKTLLKHHSDVGAGRTAPNPLEFAPVAGDCRFQNVEYVCRACGHSMDVPDAFSRVKCPCCGRVARRQILLDPNVYSGIVNEIRRTVPEIYCFHDWRHARDVVEAIYHILPHHHGLSVRQKRALLMAAAVHDIGFRESAEYHEEASAYAVSEIFGGIEDAAMVRAVQSLVLATRMDHTPRNLSEKIIRDADLFHIGTPRQRERSVLLLRELRNRGFEISDSQWRRENGKFIASHHFNLRWLQKERENGRK